MNRHLTYILIIFFLIACTKYEQSSIQSIEQELHANWQFAEEGSNQWHSAIVPGVIHLDLFNNQLIDDPYYELNEEKQRWIEEKNWVYQTNFEVTEELLNKDRIELQFEGLDTYAKVFLNGQQLLFANNMFQSWSVDVKPTLKKGENELKVVFLSPLLHNAEKVNSYPYQLPSGNESHEIEVKVSPFTRKAAYHFGWDWGPRFVTSGIWRPVKLRAWNKAKIADVYTSTQALNDTIAQLKTEVEIEVVEDGDYQLQIGNETFNLKLWKGINKHLHVFEVEDPDLWWCNGMGVPNLYEETISLTKGSQLLDQLENTYGIRTVELINETDSIGTSFYFKLNGKAVFMKGANYIPQDVFLPRVKDWQYERLLGDVKEANMNMIRVWGGGIYENDLFYELCDKNGILVWQDFMFAGSLYPSDKDFTTNIREEVIQNIKRLRAHPSLAVWCGNNEIEVAWNNWGWQKQYGYSTEDSINLWDNYQSIFHNMIPSLVDEYDASRNYTPTSPLSNWGTTENFNHSSMHYWGVWHGREPFENFEKNVGRFMVEYGFQSFPNIHSLKRVIDSKNLRLNSEAMTHRQKSYIGNDLIIKHIKQYHSPPTTFEDFVLKSQSTQAIGLKMAIESHIAASPHCMGSLLWQLNDCWPGPSWSIIDYYGKRKKAYETVKTAFSTAQQ